MFSSEIFNLKRLSCELKNLDEYGLNDKELDRHLTRLNKIEKNLQTGKKEDNTTPGCSFKKAEREREKCKTTGNTPVLKILNSKSASVLKNRTNLDLQIGSFTEKMKNLSKKENIFSTGNTTERKKIKAKEEYKKLGERTRFEGEGKKKGREGKIREVETESTYESRTDTQNGREKYNSVLSNIHNIINCPSPSNTLSAGGRHGRGGDGGTSPLLLLQSNQFLNQYSTHPLSPRKNNTPNNNISNKNNQFFNFPIQQQNHMKELNQVNARNTPQYLNNIFNTQIFQSDQERIQFLVSEIEVTYSKCIPEFSFFLE